MGRTEVEGLASDVFPRQWLTACWDGTSACAAEEQQVRLFEPEREAEMALHYLENMEGTPLLLQFVRVMLGATLDELAGDHAIGGIASAYLRMLWDRAVAAALAAFCPASQGSDSVAKLPGEEEYFPDESDIRVAMDALEALERASRLQKSLHAKFPGTACESLIEPLIS